MAGYFLTSYILVNLVLVCFPHYRHLVSLNLVSCPMHTKFHQSSALVLAPRISSVFIFDNCPGSQFSISHIFLSYPDSQSFIGFMFFSWSEFRNLINPVFDSCFGCLIHTSLIFIRYRGTPNFINPVFVYNTYFRNFIFVIFLFFLRQTASPWWSSLVLAPSLTSVPALIPQSQHSSGRRC